VFRCNNLLLHNSPLGEIDHRLIILRLLISTDDIVENLCAAIRSGRSSMESPRVLKLKEFKNLCLGRLEEVRLSEV
jgi:hypothetical protein